MDWLEKTKVITKVERSEWAVPIVIVPKSDKSIRICGDFKVTIYQSVEEGIYPLPNTEDLFTTPAGGTSFRKFDLSQVYQQLQLDTDSEKYLTINTHHGLYCTGIITSAMGSQVLLYSIFYFSQVDELPVCAKDIEKSTRNDLLLSVEITL